MALSNWVIIHIYITRSFLSVVILLELFLNIDQYANK